MKTDPPRSLRRRELELQLRLVVLDLMDYLDTTSFFISLGDDDPARAHYLMVGKIDQVREQLARLSGAGPGADDDDGFGAPRH